jgi:hypothetical protein
MVSPVRVRVPPLLFSRLFQEKRLAHFARPRIERRIHHNGHSLEVLREEIAQAHRGVAVHGGGDVSVGGTEVAPGGIEDLRNLYKEEAGEE